MAQVADESRAMESEVFRNKYRRIKSIGRGSFGEAVLVRSKADGKRYVAKAIDSTSMTSKEKRDVQNEIRILSAVDHPNIIRYHEHFEDGCLIFIIMEYADGGDLNSRIKEAKKVDPAQPFDPNLAMFWFLQICMALKYLHDNHILHRDLKTANVFLTSKNVVKLGDFGISTILQNTMACAKTVCGTPYYFSPELCQSKPYNNKSDVWALGVVFYETLTLRRPFNAKSLKDLLKKILIGQYDSIPSTVPVEMRSLCASLLQVNYMQRPSINRILESSYVQSTLRGFSEDLARQVERDKMEFEAKQRKEEEKQVKQQRTPPPEPVVEQPPEPAKPQMSEREQMAVLRDMDRGKMKAMLAKQAAEAKAVPPASPKQTADQTIHPDVDDDGDYIAQKNAIVMQTKDIVGKSNLGGHPEDFGDGPADSAPQVETITLPNGQTVLARDVRGHLEKEMGSNLLDRAVEMYNAGAMSGLTNSEVQHELNALVGPKFAHNSNAITKLAVWEGKQKVMSA
ncbi:putative serine/threonine-protein kinase putativeprotein kinase [Leptomonas pyrrhocoris]|uniref:non-specific serine/threonine protein kinase n=1 Tax=Leptomonas pyrrhocoris TaxID=157538 RepID=A0A0M9G240_LEPPY|nr:putative serine/threonine-protein kinase putativeprotein kinase [Leptomonas pyrrhocoris]XP_015659122.1 putative serine/threonine-protein kinase putativeprotein kinase [Leptomonas pyrrhocoris]KPA80682.1 putative serine/threonine-protein kinase putativeprotein kinase [Leptomonas pyrrhocoris]KPA80683.1 putative serine/threonine-protein kinase putativeprotein kinase [Leptomonas pyrrhocoris]|eukprot:XP_015659121.1 putative serine/threonine-protein kinase putativeprotein kinase [Leptomonas pyrrhocoris]